MLRSSLRRLRLPSCHSRKLASNGGLSDADAASIGSHLTSGISRITNELLIEGRGSWVHTNHNKYLDFTAGIGVTNLGHCHPHVVQAIQKQAAEFVHAQIGIGFSKPMIQLIHKLAIELKPFPIDQNSKFFFATTGAEAVENAVKVARMYTKRGNIIAFQGGYHGRTLGTVSLTSSKTVYGAQYGPLVPGIHIAPFPYATQLPGLPRNEMVHHCLQRFDMLLKQQSAPQDTAAVIIEPVLGEGGYVPAPREFLQGLRDRCDKHGILLIADEVQTGFGRTGSLFCVEQSQVKPDILVCAKGLASGMPLSAVVTRKELMETQPPGSMGGTYAGNPIACASALATLEVFQKENVLENVKARSAQFLEGLNEIWECYDFVQDVRGAGLMIGMEFSGKRPLSGEFAQIAKSKGLLLLTTSAFDCLRFIPPLTVSEEEINTSLNIIADSFKVLKTKL